MDIDKYEEVVNGENTYKKIVNDLIKGKDVLIGWTDGAYDHRDIFFSLGHTYKYGNIQRGITMVDLFVGIVDHSFYGFKWNEEKHPSYIFEKLRLNGSDTDFKIAELINGVIKELQNDNTFKE